MDMSQWIDIRYNIVVKLSRQRRQTERLRLFMFVVFMKEKDGSVEGVITIATIQ